jgi:hypothetical protein
VQAKYGMPGLVIGRGALIYILAKLYVMRWNWGSDYKGARFGRCRQCVSRVMPSRFRLWTSWPTAVYWRANTRITSVAFHGPPRAIGIPRSFNPAANSSQ